MNPARDKPLFVCRECGYESPRWLGRCPHCEEWSSFDTRVRARPAGGWVSPAREPARSLTEAGAGECRRLPTGIGEFDVLLGGGVVPGSFILIGGEPGIGKSTLMLQVAARLAGGDMRVLYVGAEESLEQTGMRARRIGVSADNLFFLCQSDVRAIIDEARKLEAGIVVVDSIQIVFHPDLPSAPGSVSQVRESASALMRMAKADSVTVFIVGHVTKSGDIAGPRMLEHMVDTVLYFEGDRYHAYRILRTQKNRFGSTQEVGIFSMGPKGLEEVGDPSRLFLSERRPENCGSVVTAALEGTRPILVEIQALVGGGSVGIPQRRSLGVDYNRLCMLLAVLGQRAGLSLRDRDVFVSVAGGLAVAEPAVDLAVVLALASSATGTSVAPDMIAIGEVGLGGELRSCQQMERRLREAGKLGFKRVIMPRPRLEDTVARCGMELLPAGTVREAIGTVIGSR